MKKGISLVLCLVLLYVCIPASFAQETAIGTVATKYGSVSGVASDVYPEVTIFKGIPYAAPPVGELRWKSPVDPQSWEEVRKCDAYGPISPQYRDQGAGSEPYTNDFFYDPFPTISEDCLYLNITTSASSADTKMPVYIWYHGGGQRHGYSYEPEFAGDELAKKGVVVITVGHRLGVFGYMALPQLTAEQGTSGNYGIMDLVKALEWVKDNIAAFGGDPDNITLGGQSGGSTKAMVLGISPASPKVNNLILQSGLKWFDSFSDLSSGEERGLKYLEHLGIDPNASLEELRSMDTTKFLATDMKSYLSNAPAGIVKDGIYVTVSNAREAVEQGALDGINVLSGTCLGEAVGATELTAAEFYAKYKETLGDLYGTYDFESLVQVTDENAGKVYRELASYGMNVGMGATYSRGLMVNRVFGDYMNKLSDKSGNMYSYIFTHFTPSKPEEAGTPRDSQILWAWHSSDLWYSFASLRDGIPPIRPWEQKDYELADTVSSYWVNFIKTGDPNGVGLPLWPQSDETYAYMELGDMVQGHTNLSKIDELAREIVIARYKIELR